MVAMDHIETFVRSCLPSWRMVLFGSPVLLYWSACCLWMAARLKRHWTLKTGYSRKIFHLLIFASAGVLQLSSGLAAVCLFGGMTTLVLAYAVWRGAGHAFYEALARERDAPYRTHYIVASYAATLIGGLISNLIAGPFALCGYLVCGLGDAAGEPIGTRWGRHWYRIPTRTGTTVQRSLEGSLGVFVVSALALLFGLSLLFDLTAALHAWPVVVAIALACTAIEALSPHGWDNATLQISASVLAAVFIAH